MPFLLPRRALAILAVFLSAYASLYLHLSRRGGVWAKSTNSVGFLCVLPDDTRHWYELHQLGRVVFGPANAIDRALGNNLGPITNICFGLSR
jgi:hypothetical protein